MHSYKSLVRKTLIQPSTTVYGMRLKGKFIPLLPLGWPPVSYLPLLMLFILFLHLKVKTRSLWRTSAPSLSTNFLNKTISKDLANRLRTLINKWISHKQSYFVSSWSVMDNALTTFKILYHIHFKHKVKIKEVALKLNIFKAFNIMSWSYLQSILNEMGLFYQWVFSMMMYISTVEYHVIFNGCSQWANYSWKSSPTKMSPLAILIYYMYRRFAGHHRK